MTNALIGLGARFGIRNGAEYADEAEVTNITLPGWTRNTVDATHLRSPEGWAEFIAGLKTASDCTFTINWVPSITDPLLAAFEAGRGEFRVVFPSGTVGLEFVGIVTNYTPGEITPEGKLSASVTIKPSGKPSIVTIVPAGGWYMSLDGKITLSHKGQSYSMTFSYKALCIYEEQMPSKNGFVTLTFLLSNGIQRGIVSARDLRAFVFGGLSVHHPDMTLDLAGEILDSNPTEFAQALQAALPQDGDTPQEDQQEKPPRPKRRRAK